jgi:iron complex outermembrane receptor protein
MKVAFELSKQVVEKLISFCVYIFLFVFQIPLTAQETVLDEVVVSSPRIQLSIDLQSRSVTILTAEEIEESGATTLIDVLSDVAGIQLQSRGAQDVQSDIYIRGGGFDQVLLLIDGIKVDNPQTGHHTLNAIIPIEMIERVEILKGAAGRVYGQNAFSGAINIVTKKSRAESLNVVLSGGSFDYKKVALFGTDQGESSNHTVYAERVSSDGYRYNTDYDNQSYFWKSIWQTDQEPIELLASFNNRSFGANGFYATPTFTDQFEATQSSLLGLTTSINGDWHIKPKLYWKRGQDEFILFKNDPSIYRNMHITNKLGVEVNATKKHALGTTGIGFELAHVSIRSNNLGEHARTLAHGYLEHRFVSNRWDVTPGFSVSYYTDQDTFFYPGIDIGFQFNDDMRLFFNSGYTYRIPTYTDLYYSDSTTLGNESLLPEKALSTELGFRHRQNNWKLSISLFQRDAKNYIDYVVLAGDERWQATNIDQILSQGGELDVVVNISRHKFAMGYAYLKDDVDGISSEMSLYAINSRKHHLSTRWTLKWSSSVTSSLSYRYAEQDSGYHYNVVDANMAYAKGRIKLSLSAHNILNADYTEQNLVPMPKGHALLSLQYQLY